MKAKDANRLNKFMKIHVVCFRHVFKKLRAVVITSTEHWISWRASSAPVSLPPAVKRKETGNHSCQVLFDCITSLTLLDLCSQIWSKTDSHSLQCATNYSRVLEYSHYIACGRPPHFHTAHFVYLCHFLYSLFSQHLAFIWVLSVKSCSTSRENMCWYDQKKRSFFLPC